MQNTNGDSSLGNMLRGSSTLLLSFNFPSSIPSSLALELMLKRSSSPSEGKHFNFNFEEAAVKASLPSPNRCIQRWAALMWPTLPFATSTYIFLKIVVWRLFFSASAGRHYFENRSARAQARGATATSFFPDRTPKRLDFNFQGKLHWEKGASARQTASVGVVSVNLDVSWQPRLRHTQMAQP